MTEKDQDAAIGAAVRLLAQAKHHRAALVAEAKQMAAAMSSLEHDLHFKLDKEGVSMGVPEHYPDRSRIVQLLAEFRSVSDDITEHQRILKDAGVDSN